MHEATCNRLELRFSELEGLAVAYGATAAILLASGPIAAGFGAIVAAALIGIGIEMIDNVNTRKDMGC